MTGKDWRWPLRAERKKPGHDHAHGVPHRARGASSGHRPAEFAEALEGMSE
jgi:hypothetical protein